MWTCFRWVRKICLTPRHKTTVSRLCWTNGWITQISRPESRSMKTVNGPPFVPYLLERDCTSFKAHNRKFLTFCNKGTIKETHRLSFNVLCPLTFAVKAAFQCSAKGTMIQESNAILEKQCRAHVKALISWTLGTYVHLTVLNFRVRVICLHAASILLPQLERVGINPYQLSGVVLSPECPLFTLLNCKKQRTAYDKWQNKPKISAKTGTSSKKCFRASAPKWPLGPSLATLGTIIS